MGIIYEDAVLIKEAEKAGEHTVITVNCPDKTGLDVICVRIILLFGLALPEEIFRRMVNGVTWFSGSLGSQQREFQQPRPPQIFLLKFWCSYDRKGLLHDVTEVLYELELTIKRVKIYTAPDGRVMDLFFITDTRELLQTSKRREETIKSLKVVLGDTMMSCDIEVAAPEVASRLQSFLPSSVSEDIFSLPAFGEQAERSARL
ncbi:ACT domain-containing protein ACR10 [Sesamum alatum]|uniref:ACT domain-containing protein ACR n=1 Tax=Sesamum alatum TaxID=300844 RepID=A0AAE1YTU6_9LAMI|nr:ACT domain-containing protein ACR10 [Sesamum alatum]